MSYKSFVPNCAICTQAVNLTESKTDEDGLAIHEDCYVSTLVSRKVNARSEYPLFTVQKPFLVRRSHHPDRNLSTLQQVNGGFWY